MTVTVVVVGFSSDDAAGSAELDDVPPDEDGGTTVSGIDTVGTAVPEAVGELDLLCRVGPVTDDGACGDEDSGADALEDVEPGGVDAATPVPPTLAEQPPINSAASVQMVARGTAKGERARMMVIS